jgi:hypothetical protein
MALDTIEMLPALRAICRFVVPMVVGIPLVLFAQIATMAMGAPDYAGIVLFLGFFVVLFLSVKYAATGKVSSAERYTTVAVGSATMLVIAITTLVVLTGLLLLGALFWVTGAVDVALDLVGAKVLIAAVVLISALAGALGIIVLGRKA